MQTPLPFRRLLKDFQYPKLSKAIATALLVGSIILLPILPLLTASSRVYSHEDARMIFPTHCCAGSRLHCSVADPSARAGLLLCVAPGQDRADGALDPRSTLGALDPRGGLPRSAAAAGRPHIREQ